MSIKQHVNWACNRLEEDYLSAYFDNILQTGDPEAEFDRVMLSPPE